MKRAVRRSREVSTSIRLLTFSRGRTSAWLEGLSVEQVSFSRFIFPSAFYVDGLPTLRKAPSLFMASFALPHPFLIYCRALPPRVCGSPVQLLKGFLRLVRNPFIVFKRFLCVVRNLFRSLRGFLRVVRNLFRSPEGFLRVVRNLFRSPEGFLRVVRNLFRSLKGFPNVLGNAFRRLKGFPNVLGNAFRRLKRFPNVLGNAFRRLKGFPNVLGNAFRSLKRFPNILGNAFRRLKGFPNILGNAFPLVGTPVGKNRRSSSAEASFPHSKSPFFSPLSTFESFSDPLGKPLDSAHKVA